MFARTASLGWLILCVAAGFCSLHAGTVAHVAGAGHPAPRTFLVISLEAFHSELNPFITHKKQRWNVELISLERILATQTGSDDPEKLKRFLYTQWRESGVGYVLLVGDIDVMPVRFMVLDRVTPQAFDYAFYPSDLYYADVAKPDGSFESWNAQTNDFHARYFGEVRGEKNKGDPINYDAVDYLPEIAVGRWPVSTAGEAGVLATKSIAYEKSLDARRLPRAAFVSVGGWVDTRRRLERVAGKLSSAWVIEKRFFKDQNWDPGTPPPDHAQVPGLFNQGMDLVIHTGHGQPGEWEQCLSYRDLGHLTNSVRLPVVFSAGCSTATFAPMPPYQAYVDVNGRDHAGTDHGEVFTDPPPPPAPYQKGKFNPTGLGEQLLKRGPHGAVAYIGCNTGSQPCAITLLEGFVEAWADHTELLGDCWNQALKTYYKRERLDRLVPTKSWYPASIFFQGMKFMMFGDPTLSLPRQ